MTHEYEITKVEKHPTYGGESATGVRVSGKRDGMDISLVVLFEDLHGPIQVGDTLQVTATYWPKEEEGQP